MDIKEYVEKEHLKEKRPHFQIGDTIKVETVVVEGERKRNQIFEGVVIRRRGQGMGETFTLRRTSYGEGVERIFPLHSPSLGKIAVSRRGRTRRSKLYYLRERSGKAARLAENLKERNKGPGAGD
ncbi:50S ribosomal protein L19 [candidate division NPL-UPA2 bacterium]|nr:50S ribosomal protein L19 [candidate division NPL-UPA2 bacterium]